MESKVSEKKHSSFIASAAVGFFFFVITLVQRSRGNVFYFVLSVCLFVCFFLFATEKHGHRVCVLVAPNAPERIQCVVCWILLLFIGIEFVRRMVKGRNGS